MAQAKALFSTYLCPRLNKNIAFCNEPNQQQFYGYVKLLPVPCLFMYDGKCQYRENVNIVKMKKIKIIEIKLKDKGNKLIERKTLNR